MAIDGGNASFTPGTGTKTIALGMTPTWMRITVKGSAFLPFQGFIYSGFQYCYPDNSTNLDTTKAIKIKNSAFAGCLTAIAPKIIKNTGGRVTTTFLLQM